MTKTKSQRARAKQAKNGRAAPSKQHNAPKGGKKKSRNRNRGKKAGVQGSFNSKHSKGSGRLGLGSGVSGATSRRSQMICEDEYIGEVNGSTGFVTTSYALNPGQALTFPWGNKIASLYEEYDYQSVEFYFKREVSEFATNGQAGKVILSFDYDASDSAPTTKQQVEDTVPHVDGMPCTPTISLKIDCARIRKNPSKYVRPGAQPANTDLKTYDAGNFYISTYGNTNTSVIGELRVRYCVKLSEPVLEASQTQGGAVHFTSIAPTTTNNFAAAVQQPGATPALVPITLGTNTIVFPAGIPGNYFISFAVAGSTGATANGIASAGTSTALNLLAQSGVADAAQEANSLAGTTTNCAMWNFICKVPTGGSTITITQSTITGGNAMDLFIFNLPSTILTLSKQEQEMDGLMNEFDAMKVALRQMQLQLSERYGSPYISVEEEKEVLDAATSSSSISKISRYEVQSAIQAKNRARCANTNQSTMAMSSLTTGCIRGLNDP